MNKNFSLRQNMQIPVGNAYPNVSDRWDLEDDIEKLFQNYEIHKPHKVKDFIKKNAELVPYIIE